MFPRRVQLKINRSLLFGIWQKSGKFSAADSGTAEPTCLLFEKELGISLYLASTYPYPYQVPAPSYQGWNLEPVCTLQRLSSSDTDSETSDSSLERMLQIFNRGEAKAEMKYRYDGGNHRRPCNSIGNAALIVPESYSTRVASLGRPIAPRYASLYPSPPRCCPITPSKNNQSCEF